MGKGILHLSIDPELIALIKAKKEITSVSNYVENLFRLELDLTEDDKVDRLEHLKMMNTRLSSDLDMANKRIEKAKKRIKELKEKVEKRESKDSSRLTYNFN